MGALEDAIARMRNDHSLAQAFYDHPLRVGTDLGLTPGEISHLLGDASIPQPGTDPTVPQIVLGPPTEIGNIPWDSEDRSKPPPLVSSPGDPEYEAQGHFVFSPVPLHSDHFVQPLPPPLPTPPEEHETGGATIVGVGGVSTPVVLNPSGEAATLHPGETSHVHKADGTDVSVTANVDGSKEVMTVGSDGSLTDVVQHTDGSKDVTTRDADGTLHTSVQYSDGGKETAEYDASGHEIAAGHTDGHGHAVNDHASQHEGADHDGASHDGASHDGASHDGAHSGTHHEQSGGSHHGDDTGHTGHGSDASHDSPAAPQDGTAQTEGGTTSMSSTGADGSMVAQTVNPDGAVLTATVQPDGSAQVASVGTDGSATVVQSTPDGHQGVAVYDGHGGGVSIPVPTPTGADATRDGHPGQAAGHSGGGDSGTDGSHTISTQLNPADGDGHPGDGQTSNPADSGHTNQAAADATHTTHAATTDHHDDYPH